VREGEREVLMAREPEKFPRIFTKYSVFYFGISNFELLTAEL
jgi:hypothetical protein